MNSTLPLLSYNHPELMEDNLWLQLLDDMDYLKDLVNSLFAYESDEDLDRTSIDVDQFLSGCLLYTSAIPISTGIISM